MLDRVAERRRAAQLARHYRDQEGLSIAEIARRLGRAEATIKTYLSYPTGEKARAVKARYQGVCRGCGAYTQPRNGKGDAYAYCKACHPGAIERRWTARRVLDAMLVWRARYGQLPSSYDWSRTHARQRGGDAYHLVASIADVLNAGPAPGEDALVDRVAAAALDRFAEYGIRRSTIDDIARRAGVSKMTVFRRFQNKQGLIEVVIAREIRRAMGELDQAWERGQTLERRLVIGFAFVARFVRGHPLFDRLLRGGPEFLLPLITVDGGPALELYRSLIAQRLRVEANAGRVQSPDIDRAAEVIARLAQSLMLTHDGTISLEDDDSLTALVRMALLPMLTPRNP